MAPRRVALWFLCAVGLILLAAVLYVASVHSSPGNSDGATVILEGKAILGGNLTLKHWALSLDSFWLVDALTYAVAVLFWGVHPAMLHVVPAIVAAAVITLGAWIAQHGRGKWAGRLAVATVVVLLGLPTHAFAQFFLMGPLHVTTTLWCLVAFVALRRGRFGWGWGLSMALLAAGLLGDLQTGALGVAPICLAGIVAMVRSRNLKVGLPALSAGLGSLVLAEVVRSVARGLGTFSIAPANPRAPTHQMLQNLHHLLTYGAALEGVGYHPFGAQSVPALLEVAHGVGLGLGLLAILAAVASIVWSAMTGPARSGHPGGDSEQAAESHWWEDVLVFGFFGGCGVFVWLSLSASGAYGRYLSSAVIFGSILGARLVGRIAERAGDQGKRAMLVGAGLLVAAGYATTFATTLTVAPPRQTAVRLTKYLERHHLDRGIGDYWSASIVTVESSDAVAIRPVAALRGGRHLARYMRQTSSTWYGGGFEFLVYNTALPWGSVGATSAVDSFGPPRHVAHVGSYTVLTWPQSLYVPSNGTFAPQSWAHR